LAQEVFYSNARELEDDKRHCRLVTTKTDESVGWGWGLLWEWIVVQALRMTCREMNIGKETERQFLTADLKIKILCAKTVPNTLSEVQKLARRHVLIFWTKLMRRVFF
jgi:hypothetical protein